MAVARLIRRYHDATVSFREPGAGRWQHLVGAPREREVILSPANTVYGPEGVCDAYGLEDRGGLLDAARRRQQALYDTAREWGSAGVAGWGEMWRDTRGEQWLRSQRYLDTRADWEADLR